MLSSQCIAMWVEEEGDNGDDYTDDDDKDDDDKDESDV